MESLKKLLLVLYLVIASILGYAQSIFKYDDYFQYRNHLYLKTPSVFLNAAGLKALARDSSASINYIFKAAKAGLVDTSYISSNSRVRFITQRKEWKSIREIVLNNTRKLTDPNKMEISFSDIDQFWKIYDQIDRLGGDKVLMEEYILKGSPGLRTFFEKRMGLHVYTLISQIRKNKNYYESIRDLSLSLHKYKPSMIAAANRLKEIYPEALFPPTYFVMGNFETFGTSDGGAGQLIGAEFFVDKNKVDSSQLSPFQKYAIADSSKLVGIYIHELIHSLQQNSNDQTLLAMSINEGAADFITELVLGYNINSKIHVYGEAHEKELWSQFKQQMNSDNIDDWLFNGMNAQGEKPGDLGYFVGYKICASYYRNCQDKKQAIRDILLIKDFSQFLSKSGYGF